MLDAGCGDPMSSEKEMSRTVSGCPDGSDQQIEDPVSSIEHQTTPS
jgi:hypothetical protein